MSSPLTVSFHWNGVSGLCPADWQFTQGSALDFRWARWASPHIGPEEAWTTRFIVHCVIHVNTEKLSFDEWLKGDIVDSERAFRVARREVFAGREAMRSAPVPGFDHLDTLLFVADAAVHRIYQFRITGLAAEQRWSESRPLSEMLASLRFDEAQ